MIQLAGACIAFVGGHFVLSGPLRAPLVKALGEPLFLLIYSLAAFATLGWVAVAFQRTGPQPGLWDGNQYLPWLIASLLTWLALVLLIASLDRNPALPRVKIAGLSARKPWGAFRVTRHPMMMGFALWGLGHLIVAPNARTGLVAGSIVVLALGGSALQDRRKLAANSREWGVWVQRTRFWPQVSRLGELGTAWVVGLVAWAIVTFLHTRMAKVPAGIWGWVN